MNKILSAIVAMLTALSVSAQCNCPRYAIDKVRDLVLIYQGGTHRIDWTKDDFKPYVSHVFANGKREWTFDGFLFLELHDGTGKHYAPMFGAPKPNQQDWQIYLDRLYAKDKGLDALDKCIGELKKEIGDPGFKHKVTLMIPTPMADSVAWGKINGKTIDFNKLEDRIAGAEWFIDQIVGRFYKNKYKNLELTGLYWLDEDMCHTADFPKHIAPKVHSLGLEFVWIPYFKARGYERWRELGFDIAYHQPNHFFDKNIPDSRLDEACDYALANGMAMEFECDANAVFQKEDSSYSRMEAYIDAFMRQHVFSTSAIAYYTGSKLFIDMVNNPCPENQRIMDKLMRIIVERRAYKCLEPK